MSRRRRWPRTLPLRYSPPYWRPPRSPKNYQVTHFMTFRLGSIQIPKNLCWKGPKMCTFLIYSVLFWIKHVCTLKSTTLGMTPEISERALWITKFASRVVQRWSSCSFVAQDVPRKFKCKLHASIILTVATKLRETKQVSEVMLWLIIWIVVFEEIFRWSHSNSLDLNGISL